MFGRTWRVLTTTGSRRPSSPTRARSRRSHGAAGTGRRDGRRDRGPRIKYVQRASYTSSKHGLYKLVWERESRRVLGLHVVTRSATDVVQGLALALKMGATVDDLAHMHHAFPTWGEGVKAAAEQALIRRENAVTIDDSHRPPPYGGDRMNDKPNWKVARLDDIERRGRDIPVREHLGIHAFGINAYTPGEDGTLINDHDEAGTGQEELYIVLDGKAIEVDGETVERLRENSCSSGRSRGGRRPGTEPSSPSEPQPARRSRGSTGARRGRSTKSP